MQLCFCFVHILVRFVFYFSKNAISNEFWIFYQRLIDSSVRDYIWNNLISFILTYIHSFQMLKLRESLDLSRWNFLRANRRWLTRYRLILQILQNILFSVLICYDILASFWVHPSFARKFLDASLSYYLIIREKQVDTRLEDNLKRCHEIFNKG